MGSHCIVGGTFDKAIEDSRRRIGCTSGHFLFLDGVVCKGPYEVKWTDTWSGEGERVYKGNVMKVSRFPLMKKRLK